MNTIHYFIFMVKKVAREGVYNLRARIAKDIIEEAYAEGCKTGWIEASDYVVKLSQEKEQPKPRRSSRRGFIRDRIVSE